MNNLDQLPQTPEMPQDPVMPTNVTPIGSGKPYFMGDYALIRFSGGEEGLGPETFWLVDKTNHTVRPFESDMALDAVFGDELKTALSHLVTIASPQVDESGDIVDGVLQDFSILGPEYAISDDGSTKPVDFSSHQLKSRYGKPINQEQEDLAAEVLDGFLKLLSDNTEHTHIPVQYISKLKSDNRLMAYYISALAYGEYTISDIYSDIVHRYHQEHKG